MKQSTKDSIDRYAKDHRPTSGFLQAVLGNDLKEAYARADPQNAKDLKEIVSYCYNNIPMNCWGSPGRVFNWLYYKEDLK